MVIWSGPANRDLNSIFEFISRDSKDYAQNVINEIVEKTSVLNTFPNIGRVVPEINDPQIRELIIYSFRILYTVRKPETEILAIIHGKRLLIQKKFK